MDLQQSTDTFRPPDLSWLFRKFGLETAASLTVHIASTTEAKHWPDGYIKPGTLLGQYTSGGNTGLWAPFVNNATDGRQTAKAIVVDGFRIRKNRAGATIGTKTAGAAVIAGTPLQVLVSKLPNLLLLDDTTNYVVTSANLPTGFVAVSLGS